jgi:2-keto-4-pentenoate hydratase
MVSPSVWSEAAQVLREAESERKPVPPLTKTFPGLDVDDAYEIQLVNIRERVAAGAVIRGHKVGLSSRPMQAMMGVHEPDYGHLVDDMFVFEDAEVSADSMCYPRIEVEVAFVLGAPLEGGACNVADVFRATEFVVPALEIIDSRIENWSVTLCDTIADNASSARLVLGGNPCALTDFDIRTIGATLRRNGTAVESGTMAAVLGNPATAVAWLANKIHPYGITLDAGHVVLPGSCTRAIDVFAGDHVRADFDRLGHVAIEFT